MSTTAFLSAQTPAGPASVGGPGFAGSGSDSRVSDSRASDPAPSLEHIERQLLENPRNPQWRFLRGVALVAAQRHAEAQDVFEKLTIDHPELPEPYNNLAVIRATLNDWEGARQVLTQAVQVLPSYALAHENLGEVYLRLAEASWVQAARLGSPNGSAPLKLNLTRELLTRIAHLAPTESPNPRPGAPSPSPQ
jgi:tetratricopeptide (TPR) repeat protein